LILSVPRLFAKRFIETERTYFRIKDFFCPFSLLLSPKEKRFKEEKGWRL